MAKQTKKERERNKRRRDKDDKVARNRAWSESIGLYGGAFVAGRVGLLDRPLFGPVTVGILAGLVGTGVKLIFETDESIIATGVTSAAQGMGVADSGIAGLRMLNAGGGVAAAGG